MLALVGKRTKFATRFFLLCALSTVVACATQKEPPALVSDPNGKPESTLPWNKQEKWELAGGIPSQLGESR
jgi:hypothetical protein